MTISSGRLMNSLPVNPIGSKRFSLIQSEMLVQVSLKKRPLSSSIEIVPWLPPVRPRAFWTVIRITSLKAIVAIAR